MCNEKVVEVVTSELASWLWSTRLLEILAVVLVLTALVASAVTAVFAGEVEKKNLIRTAAFVSIIALGVLNGMDPTAKAGRFRDAWRDLRTAYLGCISGSVDTPSLIKAYQDAERKIGGLTIKFSKEDELKSD